VGTELMAMRLTLLMLCGRAKFQIVDDDTATGKRVLSHGDFALQFRLGRLFKIIRR
jgi:hypothetical protein